MEGREGGGQERGWGTEVGTSQQPSARQPTGLHCHSASSPHELLITMAEKALMPERHVLLKGEQGQSKNQDIGKEHSHRY